MSLDKSRRNSLLSLDNLANQLDMYEDRVEPKSAAIYDYDPKAEDTIVDDFDM